MHSDAQCKYLSTSPNYCLEIFFRLKQTAVLLIQLVESNRLTETQLARGVKVWEGCLTIPIHYNRTGHQLLAGQNEGTPKP